MDRDRSLVVAVTGAAGYIAGRLIESLDADPRITRILGFDVREPQIRSRKLVFDPLDVRDPAIRSRLEGVDVLIHLAFIMDPIKDEPAMRDVNVNGSQNVMSAAVDAGVRKIIYTSSAVVYGAHPDNPIPLTEESPLRANLDFSYPAHKLEVEYVVREIREAAPDITITVFRPAIVFGAHVDNAWSHILELPALFSIKGHKPPFQFVHEDDVALALRHAVESDLDGDYNLAPDDHLSWNEVAEMADKKILEMSEPGAFALQQRLWSLGLGETPPGILHYVMHPWVVSPAKLESAGFSCRHSSAEAFRATLGRTASKIRLGTVSARKDAVRNGALVSAGALSGLALLRGRRRK